MEFRLLDESWRSAVMDLWDYCFEKRGDPFFEWYFDRYCRLPQVMGAVEADQLLAMAHLNPYQICLRGHTTPVAYYVGVATAPEARGQGLFGTLLTASLAELRRQGHGVALLMPSAASFYRPYGFAYCYHQWQFDCQVEQLGRLASGKSAVVWRRAAASDWPTMAKLYEQAMQQRHGYVVRTEDNWQAMLESLFAEGGYAFIAYDQAGEPAAYQWFVVQSRLLQVVEVVANALPALKSCLAFLHQHRSQADQASFRLPGDDLLYDCLPDASWSVRLKPFMMGRIVDVGQALRQTLPQSSSAPAELTLQVQDSIADWNDGGWRIAYDPCLSISRVAGQLKPDASLTVDALAQLCFGYYSVSQLEAKGVVSGPPAALARLSAWLPACNNFINEFY